MAEPFSEKNALWFWSLLGAGMLLAYWPMLSSELGLVQQNLTDPRLINYLLEHTYLWTRQVPGHASFFDPPFYFPERGVAAFSDLLLGTAPPYWAFRWVGGAPDTAFQLWMILLGVLNYASFYLLSRQGIGSSSLGAATGAFIFAFASPRIWSIGHPQLLPQFWTLLALWALVHAVRRPPAARGALAAFFACGVLQLYSSYYLGWFLFFALVMLAILCWRRPVEQAALRALVVSHWRWIALCAVVALIVISPMANAYLQMARKYGSWSWGDGSNRVPRVQSWFFLGGESWLYGWLDHFRLFSKLPEKHEQHLGMGLVTLATSVWGLLSVRGQSWLRLAWAVFWLIPFWASAWFFRDVTFWYVPFYLVPGASGIRALSRIVLFWMIPAAIGVGLAVERVRSQRSLLAAVALVLVCLVEQGQSLPSYPKSEARARVARLVTELGKRRDCAAFAYLPVVGADVRLGPGGAEALQIDAMWAGLETGIPTINGYSGRDPEAWAPDRLEAWATARGVSSAELCVIRLPAGPAHI